MSYYFVFRIDGVGLSSCVVYKDYKGPSGGKVGIRE